MYGEKMRPMIPVLRGENRQPGSGGSGVLVARVKLMRNYYKKFSKALSPKMAAKFLQVENQIWMLMDVQIASELPLVK